MGIKQQLINHIDKPIKLLWDTEGGEGFIEGILLRHEFTIDGEVTDDGDFYVGDEGGEIIPQVSFSHNNVAVQFMVGDFLRVTLKKDSMFYDHGMWISREHI